MRNIPRLSSNALPIIVKRLGKKAAQSKSKYRISAMGFDKRGEFIARHSMVCLKMGLLDQEPAAMPKPC